MYKIRLESIGGFGANLVGKLLGQAGHEFLGKYARAFSSYGSEKRGSPVKSYIYYSDSKILTNTPVREPDLLGIFTPGQSETGGVLPTSDVVVNSPYTIDETRDNLKLPNCRLWVIDAIKYAKECHSRVNMVMLGAMAKASGFIPLEVCMDIVKANLVANGNISALQAGWDNVLTKEYNDDKYPFKDYKDTERYTEIGGINLSTGSTITNDLQGCREGVMPEYIREKCIDCGLCESTCPDMVFQFKDGVNLGMDLYHCKGCLRCVEICPTHALVETDEGKYTKNIGNIHLINKSFSFDKTGYSSLVEGDVYDAEGSTDKSI